MIRQLPLPFSHAPQFDRMAFLEAPSNADALAWLDRATAWPQHRLAVWGAAGSGKTHLLHRWARATEATLVDGASLTLEPPRGPIGIDDADLAGERPLLHLLNAAAEAGYPLVLTGRAAPARWRVSLPDLSSRLRATLAVEIRPAEDALLRGLLTALFADRQLPVAETVQEYLLLRLPRTPAALREAAARLDRLALAAGGRITRPLAALVVAEMSGEDSPGETRFHEDLTWPDASGSPELPAFL